MTFIVGVDIGGTFTDFVAYDKNSRMLFSDKVLTTPERPAEAVIRGLEKLEANHSFKLGKTEKILHATTLATNAVIERKGALTGLLTTAGFEDVLDIRKGLRYNQYDLKIEFPPPFVPRFLRKGVRERVLPSGETYLKMEDDEVLEKTEELNQNGATSLAISFLHSYSNPANEIRARELISKKYPDLFISLSHEVTSQAREYERTSSTVIDAYIKPVIQSYLSDLSKKLEQKEFTGKLLIMTCSGGVVEKETATHSPVVLLESGPVAGVSMSREIAQELKLRGIFSFDMGGTTSKGCIVRDWRIEKSYEFEAARYDKFRRGSGIPVSIPVVRLIETGSGGGSIARIDSLGIVRVGPESAGADPGPACYSLGGKEPTVTDSDLLLGYLDPDYFLGGTMRVDPVLAKKAIENSICEKHEARLSVEEAAWAIHDRVNEDVASAFRLYASEIGVDYRKYSFIPFGGAGPVHAVRIAKKLQTQRVIVPIRAGVLSAEGLLVSPLSVDLSKSKRQELSDISYEEYSSSFEELLSKARGSLEGAGVRSFSISRRLDMCYHGQGYEVPVDLSGKALSKSEFSRLSLLFEKSYRKKYSLSGISKSIDITSYKVTLSGPSLKLLSQNQEAFASKERRQLSKIKRRRMAFDHSAKKFCNFEVITRNTLKKGDCVSGPALIQEVESTTVIPSGSFAKVDPSRNLVVTV